MPTLTAYLRSASGGGLAPAPEATDGDASTAVLLSTPAVTVVGDPPPGGGEDWLALDLGAAGAVSSATVRGGTVPSPPSGSYGYAFTVWTAGSLLAPPGGPGTAPLGASTLSGADWTNTPAAPVTARYLLVFFSADHALTGSLTGVDVAVTYPPVVRRSVCG